MTTQWVLLFTPIFWYHLLSHLSLISIIFCSFLHPSLVIENLAYRYLPVKLPYLFPVFAQKSSQYSLYWSPHLILQPIVPSAPNLLFSAFIFFHNTYPILKYYIIYLLIISFFSCCLITPHHLYCSHDKMQALCWQVFLSVCSWVYLKYIG